MQIKLIQLIQGIAKKRNQTVYLVGGTIRDYLLHQALAKDYDFVIESNAKNFLEALSIQAPGEIKTYPEFLTNKLLLNQPIDGIAEIDLAEFRSETYAKPGALPTVQAGDQKSDLARRDFSINAFAISLSDLLPALEQKKNIRPFVIDQHDGLEDLDRRLIRVLHPKSFLDDPTRIFRAARYKVRINGEYENNTFDLLQSALNAKVLDTLADYRVLAELKKTISLKNSARILEELRNLRVFKAIGFKGEGVNFKANKIEDLLKSLMQDLNSTEKTSLVKRLGLKGRVAKILNEGQVGS